MNEKLRKVLMYKYNAEVQDALYKIQCYSDHELVITSILILQQK